METPTLYNLFYLLADDSPKCFSCFDLSLENGNKEVDEAIIEDLETKKLINRGCKDHIDVDEPELSCPYGCMYGAAAGKVVVEGKHHLLASQPNTQ